VLSCCSQNVSQKGRNRLGRSKKVYKHRGFRHRHARDSQGGQHCVVILLAKHLIGTMGKVEKVKECVVCRQGTEEGWTKVRELLCIICINAIQLQVQFINHFLPVLSGFHFYAHALCSLLHVFIAQPTVHVTSVTSHQHAPHHGYNAVAGQCGAGSHLVRTNQYPLPTK
jgi:hypothetical protein